MVPMQELEREWPFPLEEMRSVWYTAKASRMTVCAFRVVWDRPGFV